MTSKIKNIAIILTWLVFMFDVQNSFSNIVENKSHGQYLDWSVFSNYHSKEKKNIMCYMVAIPLKNIKTYYNRAEAYFTITKTTGNLPEINVTNGYYYKENNEAKLSFGIRKFNLMTYKTKAWTYNVDDDIEIIKSLKIHDTFIVTATSNKNIITQDEYSLIGFNKAYNKLLELCP